MYKTFKVNKHLHKDTHWKIGSIQVNGAGLTHPTVRGGWTMKISNEQRAMGAAIIHRIYN